MTEFKVNDIVETVKCRDFDGGHRGRIVKLWKISTNPISIVTDDYVNICGKEFNVSAHEISLVYRPKVEP